MYECVLQLPMFGREAPDHWILGVITKTFVNNPGLAAAQFFYHFSFAVVNRQRRVGPFIDRRRVI